jgi:hypothetical protein
MFQSILEQGVSDSYSSTAEEPVNTGTEKLTDRRYTGILSHSRESWLRIPRLWRELDRCDSVVVVVVVVRHEHVDASLPKVVLGLELQPPNG